MRFAAAVTALFPCALGASVLEQTPLVSNTRSGVDHVERDAYHIFNSVQHLLRQWGNTLSPNGFSFTRGVIPAHTNMYHAREDPDLPPSPEWLAFDPEMSYAIMTGLCQVFLQTYCTTRPLSILYIDGSSASLTTTGTLDSQNLLIYGRVRNETDRRSAFDDVSRARKLCAWASKIGIDGFVRQDAGFELMKCNFASGLRLVRNLNVTDHAHRLHDYPKGWPCWPRGPGNHDNSSRPLGPFASFTSPPSSLPSRPPYRYRYRFPIPPFFFNTMFEWLRSATWVYSGVGEMRVKLDHTTFITAYGRPTLNLESHNDTTLHRLTSLSVSDSEDIRHEVANLFQDRPSSGIDWRDVTDQMIFRYGERLPELYAHLANGSSTSIQSARMLLVSIIVSHYDFNASLSSNIDTCTRVFTPPADPVWTPSEHKIIRAIEHVQRNICTTILSLNERLTVPNSLRSSYASEIEALMHRLDWKVWVKCEEACSLGNICLIPMWPITTRAPGQMSKPRCLNPSNWWTEGRE